VSAKLMMSSAASHCRSCRSSLRQHAQARTAAAAGAHEMFVRCILHAARAACFWDGGLT
jgi:hypothetical protein